MSDPRHHRGDQLGPGRLRAVRSGRVDLRRADRRGQPRDLRRRRHRRTVVHHDAVPQKRPPGGIKRGSLVTRELLFFIRSPPRLPWEGSLFFSGSTNLDYFLANCYIKRKKESCKKNMQKYIKYTDKNGKEIEKKYADSELMDILSSRDNSYAKMTIIDELGLEDKDGFSSISIKFYNNIPADKDAVTIKVCGIEQENIRQFILDLEKLLNKEFPKKHLFSQKEQIFGILKILEETSLPEDIDFRKEKIFDCYMEDQDIENISYNYKAFLNEVQKCIRLLQNIRNIEIVAESGEYAAKYNDNAYAVSVYIRGTTDKDWCSLSVYEWLENYDRIEKIKAFMDHLRDIIFEKWPEIPIIVDYELKKD